MVLVAFKHTQDSVLKARQPLFVVTDNIRLESGLQLRIKLRSVGFNIRLVNNIKAVFIAEIKEHRVGRIVRRSDGVDVKLLHKRNIPEQLLTRHDIAGLFVGVVMINTLEFYCGTVEKEKLLIDNNSLKADSFMNDHGLLTL